MQISLPNKTGLYVLLHLMALISLFFIPYYLVNFKVDNDVFFIWGMYLQTSVYVILFYLNYLWFIPFFLFRQKYWMYILFLLVSTVCLFFVLEKGYDTIFHRLMHSNTYSEVFKILNKSPKLPPVSIHIYSHLITSFMIIGISIGMRLTGKLMQNEKEKKELEKEKLHSELAFLKNQISPHFFFNTLNNIYSLIQINTSDAQNAVLKLSKLMRYLLYESENSDLKLSEEIDFMRNYIDLMKLRLNSKVKLNVSFPEQYSDFVLPPLLFIPFIENAFKHGISNQQHSYISVLLKLMPEYMIFECENSLLTIKNINEAAGVGLGNIEKRLKLLFGENHQLKITSKESKFQVSLIISMKAIEKV